MTWIRDSRSIFLPFVMCAAGVVPLMVCAQDNPSKAPPKILFANREFIKPGKELAHEKAEEAMAAALLELKSPTYYLTMESLTGEPRVISYSGFGSMAEMESTHEDAMKIPGGVAKLQPIDQEHGATLTHEDAAIFRFRPELSTPGDVDMASMRMAVVVHIEMKPGHGSDFDEIGKRNVSAAMKAYPDYHALVYEMDRGHQTGPTFIVILPMKSMAQIDTRFNAHDAFVAAMGADGMKTSKDTQQNGMLSFESNLYVFSPRMSYLPDSWVKQDPAFWTPKPAADAAQ